MLALVPPAFLGVDRFLRTELEARALALALACGAIDRLAAAENLPEETVLAHLGLTGPGGRLVLDLLRTGGVVVPGAAIALSPDFRAVLPFRDLIEAKIGFASLAAADLHGLFGEFVGNLPAFMARAGTFALFRYDRCLEAGPEAVAEARRWVGYTTVLTRHEAGPILDAVGLAGASRMLDLGGNSGEFAREACWRAPGLTATVLDLPAVCAIGRDHLSGTPEADRVRFVPRDMRRGPLPGGHDLVTFKSVLHDWPDDIARDLLARAAAAVAPGGRIVVAERAPFRVEGLPTFALSTNLVFMPFLRPADLYREVLEAAGLVEIELGALALETPFHVLGARRP